MGEQILVLRELRSYEYCIADVRHASETLIVNGR